jgi:hypothetical protein
MPCKPVLCQSCKYQNTETEHNCDLSDQWAIFSSDPNEPCECYVSCVDKDVKVTGEKK